MNKRWMWMILGLLIISMALAACGGDEEPQAADEPVAQTNEVSEPEVDSEADALPSTDEADSAEAEAVEEPTDTPPPPTATPEPAPTDTPEPEEEEVDLSGANFALDTLSSYTMRMTVSSTGADGQEQSVLMTIAYSSDPPGQSISITGSGIEDADSTTPTEMQMAMIEDSVYIAVPGEGCFALPNSEDVEEQFLADLPGVEEFTDGWGNVKRIRPNKTINGIETIHYRFDEAGLLDELADDDIESATGNLYVAEDGGFLVRMEIEGVGTGMNLFDETESAEATPFSIVYDIVDINQPVDITLPEGCDLDSSSSEYPITDDASETMSFPGGLMYSTALSASDLVTFYVDAMSAEGWTYEEAESFTGGDFATLIFSRDGERITVNLLGGGDATQVMIAPEE